MAVETRVYDQGVQAQRTAKALSKTVGLDHDKLDSLDAFRFVEVTQGIRSLGPIITWHHCPVLQRSDDIGDISPERRMKQPAVDLPSFADRSHSNSAAPMAAAIAREVIGSLKPGHCCTGGLPCSPSVAIIHDRVQNAA